MISAESPSPSVCIVTAELVGPHRNGGLGTAMTGLVELLAAHDTPVTILYTGDVENGGIEEWQQCYADAGARLIWLRDVNTARQVGLTADYQWNSAWPLFDYLRTVHFDIIHFNDTLGEGVFCIAAKKLGLAFEESLLCVALHSPTEWILEANKISHAWPGFSIFLAAEKVSIAHCDLLWGPSEYLMDWARGRGYPVPGQRMVRQYVVPTGQLFSSGKTKFEVAAQPPAPLHRTKFNELVFFGRLEERKGLRLFVNVLTRLNDRLTKLGMSVVFMGKIQALDGVPSNDFIQMHARNWTFAWRIESSFDQQEATAYLQREGCLAVMASPVDNSPCTVYEALEFAFPFIAARTGGIPELMQASDRDTHLFDYSIAGLSSKLVEVLTNGLGVARAKLSAAERRTAWLDFHANWRDFRPPREPRDPVTDWGIVVEHSGDTTALDKTLSSVMRELGSCVRGIAVVLRVYSGDDLVPGDDRLVVGEFNDVSGKDIVDWLNARGAKGLICIKSGGTLSEGSGLVIQRTGGTEVAALAPFIGLEDDGSILPVLASPALSFMDHGPELGGFVVTNRGFASLLNSCEMLNRERIFAGTLDHLHSTRAEILPLPEPIFSYESLAGTLTPRLGETEELMNLASLGSAEVSRMLGIGRQYYRSHGSERRTRRDARRRLLGKLFPFWRKQPR